MLTPENLAKLRRLLDECQPGRVIVRDLRPTHNAIWLDSRHDSDDGWESLRTLAEIDTETETVEVLWGLDDAVLIAAAINALPALLDAAEERDALAAIIDDARHTLSADGPKVEPARQVLARALPQITAWQDRTRHARDNTPPHVIAHRGAQLDAVTAERDALAADRDALRAMLAGRCLSDITHRDEEHRQSVCMLPKDHAPLMHDDCMGCTWTDADHWEPSAIDALAEECDGWRHLADVRAAKLDAVREWIDRRGVDVSDRDDDYMRGYRAAQRHALQDAVDLRRTLDADGLDPDPACLIHDVSGEDVRGWEMAECTCPTVRTLDGGES